MRRWTTCAVCSFSLSAQLHCQDTDGVTVGASEVPVVGSLTFHNLGLIIAAACTLIAILLSFYLMWMHALHYTNPSQQRQYVPSFRTLFSLSDRSQHHPHSLHGPDLCRGFVPRLLVLLACHILPSHLRMLRSLRYCLLLRPPLSLYRPAST